MKPDTVLIVTAHRKESIHLARSLGQIRSGPLPFRYSAGRYLFYLCGMGPDICRESLERLIRPSFRAGILYGTVGCLVNDYGRGTVVECPWVRSIEGEDRTASISFGLPRVPVVSVDRPVLKREQRKQLYEDTGALMVDMESASFAAAMERVSIPWGIIRVVSDTPQSPSDFHFSQEIDTLLADAAISAAEVIEEVFGDH